MKTNIIKSLIILTTLLGFTNVSAQQGAVPTTLASPEWEFFDDFEGAIDNSFWICGMNGAAEKVLHGVDRLEATSKVLEMKYYAAGTDPHTIAPGDSWTECDFGLTSNGISIQAVQVEVSFKIFTPANYVPVELNHKFFMLWSGNYGGSVANIAVNSEAWGNESVALPSINPGIDQVNYGHSWNMDQLPVWETGSGEWSSYQIFLELATEEGDYGLYEIFKDNVLLTATYAPNLNNWGWTGNGNPDFNGNELIKYASSTINNGGNFIDQGTLLGWANGAPGGGFQEDTKFLIDDFRIRANAVHGAVLNSNDLILTDGFESN